MPEIPKVPTVKPVLLINQSKEGWVWFLNSKKAHYVREGRALCGRWMYLGSTFEQGNDDSVDNCAECRRRLLKTNWREEKKLAKEGLIQ
jgi:hypothetical protein